MALEKLRRTLKEYSNKNICMINVVNKYGDKSEHILTVCASDLDYVVLQRKYSDQGPLNKSSNESHFFIRGLETDDANSVITNLLITKGHITSTGDTFLPCAFIRVCKIINVNRKLV